MPTAGNAETVVRWGNNGEVTTMDPHGAFMSIPHEVIRAKCQCTAGLGGADPVGSGMPGSMSGAMSTTSGAGGR